MTSNFIYTHPHFIDNKYQTLYFKIINNAKTRAEISGYTEKHHVIPRSMGGDDSKNNIVQLTAREHFICHYLLLKFTVSKSKSSMYYAFGMLSLIKPNPSNNNRYVNSRLYDSFKTEYAKVVSESMRGRKHSPETISKMKATHTGKKTSEETKAKLAAAQTGKKLDDETKAKMSAVRKGKPKSEEHKAKIGAASKGRICSDETRNKMSIAAKRRREILIFYQDFSSSDINSSE